MPKFEKVQLDILNSVDQNQLVSAGAGSGKTTVMIEKIANLLFAGVEVEDLLVVTFTVLAAQEMKDRLIQKLKEKLDSSNEQEKILNLIDRVKNASIDTIDGFSSKTIKKYFYELEITPNINIISDATKDYLISRAIKKTIDEFSKTENANLMLDLYGGKRRNFSSLQDLILTTYNNIISLENYQEFLDHAIEEYGDSIKSEFVVLQYIKSNVEKLKNTVRENYSNKPKEIQDRLSNILNDLEKLNFNLNLKSNLQILKTISLEKFSTKENKIADLKDVNLAIGEFEELKNFFFYNGIDEDFEEKNAKTKKILQIFIELVENFINYYNQLKVRNDYIDFNDLNRLMLQLLKKENVRKELQSRYKYIFIDEYQDVNPLQDSLMKLLTGEKTKVFMVGDVKQSIYGFRGASPEWFLDKYQNFKQNSQLGTAFDMNINFRSSPKILNFINDTFSRLMTKNISDIDYANDCMIEPQLNHVNEQKVKILLVNNKEEKPVAQGVYSVKNHDKEQNGLIDKQAFMVLDIITKLVGTKFFDIKLNKERILTYKDIAILSRAEKDEDIKKLIDLLKNNAVPLKINNKLEVTTSEGIKLLVSILSCVIGSADDVDVLSAILALTDITMDEIVQIRDKEMSFRENLSNEKDNQYYIDFKNKIKDIREMSYTKNNSQLIRYILNEHKLKYYLLQKKLGAIEVRTIEEFLNKLTPSETNLNLTEFVNLIKSSVNRGSDFASMDSENSVTIQTIHKSKGLEYPVVIIYNTGKEFSYLKEKDGVNFNADIGLGMDYFDTANRIKMYSLPKFAIKIKNADKGYKEELRLLYVALTRAKNKLYIIGEYSPKKLAEDDINKTSYANMLLSCYKDRLVDGKYENENCEIELLDDILTDESVTDDIERNSESIYHGFSYDTASFALPFKNTVTGINKIQAQNQNFVLKDCISKDVQYNIEEDRAIVGTQYHSALEKLDFSTEYKQNTEYEFVDYDKIKKAHEIISPYAKNAILHKEAEFMMYVPYNEIAGGEVVDKVLLQGVVDLIIERENSVDIVDYKFSTMSINALKIKYAEQLNLYKKAVEKAFKKKVEHMYIYLINTGEIL